MTMAVHEPDQPRQPGARRPDGGHVATTRRFTFSAWNLLLLLPLLGTLFPMVYNKKSPEAFNIPFFYWYQMMWVPIGVVITIVVYRATRGER
jgi:cell division protein FtsW (lipid II flippase)